MALRGRQSKKDDSPVRIPIIGSRSKAETTFRTPDWVLSYDFPWNPDPLAKGNNYDIYDEMRDDDQVKAAIAIKKDMVVNTGWRINGENPEVNEFVTNNLEHINESLGLDSSFDDILRDMLSAYEYGFSLTEPTYIIKDSMFHYKSLRTRAPHSFKFFLDDFGNVAAITQRQQSGEIPLKPSQFLHHVYQLEFGNPYGKSDLRAAYKAWKAKIFIARFFAIHVEKYASPTIVGMFPRSYTDDEIRKYHDILKSIQHATTIGVPDDVTLKFEQAQRDSSDIYIKGLDYYNMQIARSILVPDLLGIGGTETKGGSFALGREQFKLFLGTIQKDRESLSRKITMKLIRPMVLANFGDIDCWFEFIPHTHADIEEYLKIWVDAVSKGIYQPSPEEISHFKTTIGFPDVEQNAVTEPVKPDVEVVEENAQQYQFKPFRELTTFEQKTDFERMRDDLDIAENTGTPVLLESTKVVTDSLIRDIQSKNILNKFKPDKINDVKPAKLRSMNVVLRNYFTTVYNLGIESAKRELVSSADVKKSEIRLLPEEFLELIRNEAFKIVGEYSFNITKKAKNMILQGIKNGQSEGAILESIRKGLKNESDVWVRTIIRTKTTEVFNKARKLYWETDPIAKEIITGYQWSSVLDNRTSPICKPIKEGGLDGTVWPVGENPHIRPPAHFNCRSLLIPITRFEKLTPTPKSAFKKDRLLDKGGSLLFPNEKSRVRAFQIEDMPNLINSKTVLTFGDVIAVASPGADRQIAILAIDLNNLDLEKPVMVGLRVENIEQKKFEVLLDRNNRSWQKIFDEGWILPPDTGLVLNISAPLEVNYSIEYVIIDQAGNRVL